MFTLMENSALIFIRPQGKVCEVTGSFLEQEYLEDSGPELCELIDGNQRYKGDSCDSKLD